MSANEENVILLQDTPASISNQSVIQYVTDAWTRMGRWNFFQQTGLLGRQGEDKPIAQHYDLTKNHGDTLRVIVGQQFSLNGFTVGPQKSRTFEEYTETSTDVSIELIAKPIQYIDIWAAQKHVNGLEPVRKGALAQLENVWSKYIDLAAFKTFLNAPKNVYYVKDEDEIEPAGGAVVDSAVVAGDVLTPYHLTALRNVALTQFEPDGYMKPMKDGKYCLIVTPTQRAQLVNHPIWREVHASASVPALNKILTEGGTNVSQYYVGEYDGVVVYVYHSLANSTYLPGVGTGAVTNPAGVGIQRAIFFGGQPAIARAYGGGNGTMPSRFVQVANGQFTTQRLQADANLPLSIQEMVPDASDYMTVISRLFIGHAKVALDVTKSGTTKEAYFILKSGAAA